MGRAAASLMADGSYSGETWQVPIQHGSGEQDGLVIIRVETPEGQTHQRHVRVEARWPDASLQRSLFRKDLVIHLPGSGDTP